MADEITDLLEEVRGFEIPSHLQKFLHPERPPSESERSLSFFSYSYELAFLQLAASVKGRWRHNDLLKTPLSGHDNFLSMARAISDHFSRPGQICRPAPNR
jgi:hypothetical protein